jgi:hypothetical protein
MSTYRKVQGFNVLINADVDPAPAGMKNFKILAFVVHSWYNIATWPAESAEVALKEFRKANPKAESQYGGLKATEE